jgi:hypothetical protein
VSAPAFADEPADEVTTRRGEVLKGTIMEVARGDHLTITLDGTHESRTVPWSDLDRINGDPAAAPNAPGAASAADEPADTLRTRRGAVLKGTITEVAPGDHVTIRLQGTRETRAVPWDEVDQINDEPPRSPSEIAAKPEPPKVHLVHVDSPQPGVKLYMVHQTPWMPDSAPTQRGRPRVESRLVTRIPLCTAPCDRRLSAAPHQLFVLDGEGLTTSSTFTLDDRGDVNVRVRPGKTPFFTAGIAMSVAGLIGVGGGIGVLGASRSNRLSSGSQEQMGFAGVALCAASAGSLIVGVAMALVGRTTYDIDDRPPAHAAAPARSGSPGGL